MAAVLCVLAVWTVCQNQVVPPSSQQVGGSLLNLFGGQWRLVRTVIEIRHLTIRSQSPQSLAKPWRAVRICRSAQGDDAPEKLRMGQNIAAAPKRLVVGMGDDDGGPGARV
jgi:hypothetical protein